MSKSLRLSSVQKVALVALWRSPVYAGTARTVESLARLGLVRYTSGEFLFRWSPGCSSNAGWILTDAGKALIEELRPARSEEVLEALRAIPNPTEQQLRVLRQMEFWRAADDSAPNFTAEAVAAP